MSTAAVQTIWADLVVASLVDGGVIEYVPRGADAHAPWRDARIRDLATRIARERSFEDMPVLGDALEAAGCDDAEMIARCHAPHAGDRCWVVDRLLER